MKASAEKQRVREAFRKHVSSGKVAFYEKYGLDFVLGRFRPHRVYERLLMKDYGLL